MKAELKVKANIITGYLLALVAFFLPLKPQLATLCIILSIVTTLPFANWKNFWFDLKGNKFFLLSIAYFMLHCIGVIYSTNVDYAVKDIELKLSFIIFPILITAAKPSLQQMNFIKRIFIAGCITALLICLCKAAVEFNKIGQSEVFFYEQLSCMMHTTYFSFYINVALLFLIDNAYKNYNESSTRMKLQFFVIEMLLLIGISLLSARMALMVTAFTLIEFVTLKALMHKDSRKLSAAILISFVLAAGIQFQLNKIYNRFAQIENTIVNEKQVTEAIANNNAKPEEYNSTTSRIALWKYATELILSSPQNMLVGVGTGDIKDELMKVYVNHHFQKGIDEHYNPHNQYLHTAVSLGLIGLFLLAALLFYPLMQALIKKEFVAATFLVIIILNALTESILEVQSGIIFFCFFYCLLIEDVRKVAV